MATNYLKLEKFNCQWRPAMYNGEPVIGLLVSDTGLMRRVDRYGQGGQVSCGTPNFNKANGNRLRQFEVCITTKKGDHRCVNLHRIVYETFTGDIIEKGYDLDHIDCNVANGCIENLQKLTHSENCRKKNLLKPRTNIKTPIAAQYRYQMCLQLNCRTLAELPRAYFREYYRLASCERRGVPAIPRRINGGSRRAAYVA